MGIQWAACLDGIEFCYSGATREEAIDALVTDEWDADGIVGAGPVDVTIYEAPEWCDGRNAEACEWSCGGAHEDGRWEMTGWKAKTATIINVSTDDEGDLDGWAEVGHGPGGE